MHKTKTENSQKNKTKQKTDEHNKKFAAFNCFYLIKNAHTTVTLFPTRAIFVN